MPKQTRTWPKANSIHCCCLRKTMRIQSPCPLCTLSPSHTTTASDPKPWHYPFVQSKHWSTILKRIQTNTFFVCAHVRRTFTQRVSFCTTYITYMLFLNATSLKLCHGDLGWLYGTGDYIDAPADWLKRFWTISYYVCFATFGKIREIR